MAQTPETENENPLGPSSLYDPDPTPEEDLWFLAPYDEEETASAMPWPMAAREDSLHPEVWQAAEAAEYKALISAAEAVARLGARLQGFPAAITERLALTSVAAVLRGEGVWLGPEQIALYRALRALSDDQARDLARAAWAVRRLSAGGGGPLDGLRAFLGRTTVTDPYDFPGEERPIGPELDVLGDDWGQAVQGLVGCHRLTRAAFGFATWRARALTPWDELLEPTVAAMLLGGGGGCGFLPMGEGRLDRHAVVAGAGGAEMRLRSFYATVEAGAQRALMEFDRLMAWQDRAQAATADLSGRTPPALIAALLHYPILSAELAVSEANCSAAAARRNLNLFAERDLIRELTGQNRYRFWTVKM